jgi:TrmH family RNA methyltransferase
VSVGRVVLVEPSRGGNLGAAMRVAANFGVPRLDLVRPAVDPDDDEVAAWACGGDRRLAVHIHDDLTDAVADCRLVVATASIRGREGHPAVDPARAVEALVHAGADATALVFGNETRGLTRDDLDRCDLTVRIPTVPEFPVLNVTQAVAVLLGVLAIAPNPVTAAGPSPAPRDRVDGLMDHLRESLAVIGFLDPQNPDRILRKLRRLLGRAHVTTDEVDILRGICRQMTWAATRDASERWLNAESGDASEVDEPSDLVDRFET